MNDGIPADILEHEYRKKEGLAAPAQAITVADPPAASMLNFIAMALERPEIDVTKLNALLQMQREVLADDAKAQYHRAMNAAQRAIEPVARTAENTQTHSFYAKLEDVDRAIRPVYLEHGFSLSYNTVAPLVSGNIRVECLCSHLAGHTERFYREAPADTLGPKGTAVKTVLHGGGSTETFLKRYLTCGVFNVVFKNQDDDGVRGGMEFITAEQAAKINQMVTEAKWPLDNFLLLLGVESIPDIQVSQFVTAENLLIAKRQQQTKAKATTDA